MTALKPCPFCGGEAEVGTNFGGSWIAFCAGRACEVAPVTHSADNAHEATRRWNRRAADNAAQGGKVQP